MITHYATALFRATRSAAVQATDPADVDGVVACVTTQLNATDFDLGLPATTVGAAYAQGFLEGAADILAKV